LYTTEKLLKYLWDCFDSDPKEICLELGIETRGKPPKTATEKRKTRGKTRCDREHNQSRTEWPAEESNGQQILRRSLSESFSLTRHGRKTEEKSENAILAHAGKPLKEPKHNEEIMCEHFDVAICLQ